MTNKERLETASIAIDYEHSVSERSNSLAILSYEDDDGLYCTNPFPSLVNKRVIRYTKVQTTSTYIADTTSIAV